MSDKKIVRITLLVLFLSLFLVYAIFFQQKEYASSSKTAISPLGEKIENPKQTGNAITDLILFGNENTKPATFSSGTERQLEEDIAYSGVQTEFENTGNADLLKIPGFSKNATTGVETKVDIAIQEIFDDLPALTGTISYFGDIDATRVLGLDSQFILVDTKYPEIFYVYMGTGIYDYQDQTKQLSGEVFTLRTELDIVKNGLFGDTVQFINIPDITYTAYPVLERKIVFMAIYYKGNARFIQLPYQNYHKLKKHIKQIFEESHTQ